MTYPYNFVRLTFGGTLTDTDEIFTFQMHAGVPGRSVTAQEFASFDGTIVNLYSHIRTLWTGTAARVPAAWNLVWAKAALIGPDGTYIQEPIEYLGGPDAGQNTGLYAPQLAL